MVCTWDVGHGVRRSSAGRWAIINSSVPENREKIYGESSLNGRPYIIQVNYDSLRPFFLDDDLIL